MYAKEATPKGNREEDLEISSPKKLHTDSKMGGRRGQVAGGFGEHAQNPKLHKAA